MAMKRLVINADDFGWSGAVTEGILGAHLRGIVTSTTLMANLEGAEEALARARREAPTLGIGLHLTLTEGRPLAPPAEVEALVDGGGRLRRSLAGLFCGVRRSRRIRQAVARELEAQAAWAHDHGLKITHLDSHKHVHLHPALLPEVIALARRHGVRAVRTTVETDFPNLGRLLPKQWGTRERVAQWVRARMARRWGRAAQRAVRQAGLITTDWFFGVRATGGLSGPLLCHLMRHAPGGTGEVMAHPGLSEDRGARTTRLAESRPRELEAVEDPAVRAAAEARGWRLVTFEELTRE